MFRMSKNQVRSSTHVSYGEPRLTFQRIYWSICRSLLDRPIHRWVGYVPRVYTGRTSTKLSANILTVILLVVYRQRHISQLLVNYRWYTGQGLAYDVHTQIKICKIRMKICFRIAVICRLFTCSSSNKRHLVAIFM